MGAVRSDAQLDAMAARSLGRLVAWALDRYHDDLPERLHGRGPWNGPQQYQQGVPQWPEELVGGSRMASPRLDDAFRRYLEDSPYAVAYAEYDNMTQRDPHYARPFAANLAFMRHHEPILATRIFFLVACCGGDVHIPYGPSHPAEQAILYREALRLLYDSWRTEPPARVIREKVA